MKTLLELFAKYQWLEERIGRGLPIPISKERQQVYARRVRRRRSAHIAELPQYRQELDTMCFAAMCFGTLVDDMLRLLEIRITSIWSWGHKVVADPLVPARLRKKPEILAELRRLVADKTLTDEAFRAKATANRECRRTAIDRPRVVFYGTSPIRSPLDVVLDLSQQHMNRREINIEHPTQPEVGVIPRLLFVVVVSDPEIIGDIEQITFVS